MKANQNTCHHIPETGLILVVDDQETNLQLVANVLTAAGHEMIPASSGKQALQRLEARVPDLILLDLLMPEMDGLEVCRRIQANPSWAQTPIIFVSAADDKDLIVRALDGGGVDYVTKPFNKAELLARVSTHLALKGARERAERLAQDKDELLGILAHDMNNHLAGIHLSASLLAGSKALEPEEKLKTLSKNIQNSAQSLIKYVAEFLANATADHGFCVAMLPVDLSLAATTAVESFEVQAQQKGIALTCTIPTEPVMTHADLSCIEQVLDNILSNALKFSPAATTIHVQVTMNDTHATCTVLDQGPGFTPEDLTKLFQRYGRLTARPTAGEPSTGLGLSIVKKMLDAMQGRIHCETVPGGGAKLTITLPRSEHL